MTGPSLHAWRSVSQFVPRWSPSRLLSRRETIYKEGSGGRGLSSQSYERGHDRGGVAQSLDGGVGALLEVVVVAWHVEGGEGRPAALHGPGQGAGRQRHAQPAVGGQRPLDGVGEGGGGAAHGGQGLGVLEAREAGGGGDPGAQREVIRGGEGGACGQTAVRGDRETVTHNDLTRTKMLLRKQEVKDFITESTKPS